MVDRNPTEAAVTDSLNELEEDGIIETECEEGEEPRHSLTQEGALAAEDLIQEKAGAQLMLLQLHWNSVCVEADSTKEALHELFCFVAKMRDDIGVNVLRTHQEMRESVEQDPLPEFTEATLQRFDPDVSTTGSNQEGNHNV